MPLEDEQGERLWAVSEGPCSSSDWALALPSSKKRFPICGSFPPTSLQLCLHLVL